MSAIRLYLDEDATQHALVAGLRLRGVDVTSALETGMIGVFDEPRTPNSDLQKPESLTLTARQKTIRFRV